MPQYRATVRLRVQSTHTLEALPHRLQLPDDVTAVVDNRFKADWEGGHCLEFSLGPYETQEAGEAAQTRLSSAILWTCVSLDIAARIDKLPVELVQHDIPLTVKAAAVVGWQSDVFESELALAYTSDAPAVRETGELHISLELFNRAELEATTELRFVTLVMALEVLAKPQPLEDPDINDAVDRWLAELQTLQHLEEKRYNSLHGRLRALKIESISQALSRYATALDYQSACGDVEVLVKQAYNARSDILHSGKTKRDVGALHLELKKLLRAIYADAYGRPFKKERAVFHEPRS